jgi:hypothetical protein
MQAVASAGTLAIAQIAPNSGQRADATTRGGNSITAFSNREVAFFADACRR